MKPVPVLVDDHVAACKIAARVTACGMVTSVDKERNSFIMFPTQTITSSAERQTLPLRAVLEKGPKWPNPTARLPSPHAFIAFTGKLAHFEDNTEKMKANIHSRAVISLDSITYLRANYGPTTTSVTPSTSRTNDPDTVALKSRVLNYSNTTSLSKTDILNLGVGTCKKSASQETQEECDEM